MATTTPTTPSTTEVKAPIWKQALALTFSLLFLFLLIYVISRAWKKGQVNG
jgi:hypothetical protein